MDVVTARQGGETRPRSTGPLGRWGGSMAGLGAHWLGGMPLGWQATWHLTGALQGVPGDLDAG